MSVIVVLCALIPAAAQNYTTDAILKNTTGKIATLECSGIARTKKEATEMAKKSVIYTYLYNGIDGLNDNKPLLGYKPSADASQYVGQANNVSFSTFKSDIDGKMYNKAEVTLALKVYNIIDGAMVGSETVAVTGVDADPKDGAFNDAMKDLRKAMTKFVDNHFKFETYILELGEADKKGRVKDLYISGGSEMGVAKKTRFKVYTERKIGPKVTKSEIGTLVAVEVMEGVTKCQVAAGEDAIKEKFNSGEKLIVIVDKQGTAAGGFLKGLEGA